eukprot:681639-Amorphochlora_amoeboformis.AAC.1
MEYISKTCSNPNSHNVEADKICICLTDITPIAPQLGFPSYSVVITSVVLRLASLVVDQESLSRLSTGALSYWLRHVAAAKFKISDATIEKIVHESIDGECLLLIQTQEEHFKS